MVGIVNHMTTAVKLLPAKPDEFGPDAGGFIQRWKPGAFGPHITNLDEADIDCYRVLDDEWDTSSEPLRRTILKAEALTAGDLPGGQAW